MRLYIVRHGQSELNHSQTHQFPDTPLSAQGLEQAEFIANRFKSIPIDAIWASPYKRAHQTAEAISHHTGLEINFTELLVERRNPSEVLGKLYSSPESTDYRQKREEHKLEPDWKYSDDESKLEVHIRAKKALDELISQQYENILIVSHGGFIFSLITYMAFGEKNDMDVRSSLSHFLHMSNTGITICDYKNGQWKLISWNDIAHLGEIS